jgi:DMSO/TMAO reductase YedYZ molybdopterin-dependent catalytic subunit
VKQREVGVAAAAICGVIAGAAGIAIGELLAGLISGVPSPVSSVGAAVIALQPPGAEQVVIGLFGAADKLVLSLTVLVVALALAAGLGVVARRRPDRSSLGFVALGVLTLLAELRDPLAAPVLAIPVGAIAVLVAIWTRDWLLRRAVAPEPRVATMPDWGRRRFLGASLTAATAAVVAGTAGRVLLEQRSAAIAGVPPLPAPASPLPSLAPATSLAVDGLTPIVPATRDFYRIDTQLLTPHLDAASWELAISGLVDHPLTFRYADLVAMPQIEEYVTLACVSNEVGGHLVGNARWSGVPLRALLDRAGVQPEATQLVGRAFDGWTAGFPTAWLEPPERVALVALAMNGAPLPAEHGYPARLIVPGLFGYVSNTKWLTESELTTLEACDAYWVRLGWAKEGPILTQSRIDTPGGGRTVSAGEVPVAGVAWAPDRGISRVEVQVDDGGWAPAQLSAPISRATWVQFLYRWPATPGRHRLRVRATDGGGVVQSAETTPPAPDGARGYHTIEVNVQ